jgi:hypothetical protein
MQGIVSFTYGNMKRYAELQLVYTPGREMLLSHIFSYNEHPHRVASEPALIEILDQPAGIVHKAIWNAVYKAYKKHCRARTPGQESDA